MSDSKFNLTALIPWLLSMATILVGIQQFSEKQAQANREPFLQKQLELGFETSEVAARLASETDATKWEAARQRFWQLYWGPLSIVEDPSVEAEMVNLGGLVPKAPSPSSDLPMTSLQGPSYRLAHAIRQLTLTQWEIDLPALPARRSGTN
ncbi:hypothetical protein HFO68_34285 [Rhizobium laguerreae]|uniref:hypothetical protein n=1 Tax=Rhizobium TaxID=379 RepID=UPI001C91F42C|nr:hypothetical protein [Rhizobium laguerreae]MBY3109534.1 hypothetical protein [Rhizobium laguerreae]